MHELGVWLHRQRFELRRGELDPRKAEALDDAAPGWLTGRKRGTIASEARWQDRLTALATYRAAGQDWPRHKAKPEAKSTSSASGCTPSGSSIAAATSVLRGRRR